MTRDGAGHDARNWLAPGTGDGNAQGAAEPAGAWRRFMGVCYEGVILFGVLVFFGYAFSALAQFRGEPGATRWAFQAFLALVLAVYFTWFWSEGRRTLPMKTLELVLRDQASRPLGMLRALARFLAAGALYLGAGALAWGVSGWLAVLLLLPLATTLVDRRHRALYDLIAGTVLLHERAPSRPALRPDS